MKTGYFDFGPDFVFNVILSASPDEYESLRDIDLNVPGDPATFQDAALNYMVGYAYDRDPATPPTLWAPDEVTRIVEIAETEPADLYTAANLFLDETYGEDEVPYIVFVADLVNDGTADVDGTDLFLSLDAVVYDNRFVGNEDGAPVLELDEPFTDDNEDGIYNPGDRVFVSGWC